MQRVAIPGFAAVRLSNVWTPEVAENLEETATGFTAVRRLKISQLGEHL